MPQVFSSIDIGAIVEELRRRGYGIDQCHGFAFRLAVRSKTDISKSTGLGFYEPIGGVTHTALEEIRVTSRNAANAADRVESICTGKTTEPAETDPAAETRGGVDAEAVMRLVDNKVKEAVSPLEEKLNAVLAAVQASAAPAAAPKPRKKGGWPKGKPRGPRKPKELPEPVPDAPPAE